MYSYIFMNIIREMEPTWKFVLSTRYYVIINIFI